MRATTVNLSPLSLGNKCSELAWEPCLALLILLFSIPSLPLCIVLGTRCPHEVPVETWSVSPRRDGVRCAGWDGSSGQL